MKKANKKHDFKCDTCGRFIPFLQLEKGGGASSAFVPDSEMTYEEHKFRCKMCTSVYGICMPSQSVFPEGLCGIH